MKRSAIAAVMLLGTTLAAHAETDVWNDIRKPWRSNAEMDSALQADVSICDREVGEQRGPVTSKYKKCMLKHHWKFGHAIRTPASPIVVHNGGVPVDNSNDEAIRRQDEAIRNDEALRRQQEQIDQQNRDIQRMNQEQIDQQQQIINKNRLGDP